MLCCQCRERESPIVLFVMVSMLLFQRKSPPPRVKRQHPQRDPMDLPAKDHPWLPNPFVSVLLLLLLLEEEDPVLLVAGLS